MTQMKMDKRNEATLRIQRVGRGKGRSACHRIEKDNSADLEIKSTFTSGERDTSETLQAAQCLGRSLMLHIWVWANCRVTPPTERDKNGSLKCTAEKWRGYLLLFFNQ